MKLHAQFFHLSTGYGGKPIQPIEMCGSDGVLILDGRVSIATAESLAWNHALKLNANLNKGIVAYQIRRGERFTSCHNVTPIINL